MTEQKALFLARERNFSLKYVMNFDKEWENAVAKLKKSGYDLSKIKIVESRGKRC